jgi:signal transduction histidine kinase
MLPEVPAVVVPIAQASVATRFAAGPAEGRVPSDVEALFVGFGRNRNALVVALDAGYLRQTMLTSIAARHFSRQSADLYEFSVVDRGAAPVLTSLPDGGVIDPAGADITMPFFGLRLNRYVRGMPSTTTHMMAWTLTQADGTQARADRVEFTADLNRNVAVMVGEPPDDGGASTSAAAAPSTAVGSASVRLAAAPGWQLRVQHADGSLEAAVANARSRNLWLSFGMLALLLASVGLVVVNAQRSERLAARQMDFVATVSHELRTPLAVIRSAAQNLQAGVVLEQDQARRYGDLIEGEGRRLTDMVEQVLEYAGLSGNRAPVRARPVDVRALADDVMESCRGLLDEERFETAMSVPADLPPVLADPEALRRALQNLVTNALKYAADGRWVGIAADTAAVRGAREVRLHVSDRGRGIDAEDLPHIFEPFYRGRYAQERQIGGNGLGLSLVRRIAEAHGGRLTVKSAAGQGTTFTLHLPIAPGDPAAEHLRDAAPEAGNQPI